MISINLDDRLLQVKTKYPIIDLSNIVQVITFLEELLPLDKTEKYVNFEAEITGTELVNSGVPTYICAIDYVLDSLVSTFSNITETELKRQVSQEYFRLKQIREDIVQKTWKLLGTNRVESGSLRYTFMTNRPYFILEKKMRKFI